MSIDDKGLPSDLGSLGLGKTFRVYSRRQKFLMAFSIASVVLALGVRFITEFNQIRSTPIDAWTRDQRADCAVVLTGGSGRVKEGMDLLARHAIRKLIVSGVNPQADWRDIFPNWPYYQDVSEADIVLERKSRTTFGNAQQSLAVVEALGCRDLLLITSSFHLHRALKTFRAEFDDRMPVEGRAIAVPSEAESLEIATEAMKALFYGLWAY